MGSCAAPSTKQWHQFTRQIFATVPYVLSGDWQNHACEALG
ncbi:hypothetical protein ACZ87_02601, partial [Candidatus Erwinia dacicola]